MIEEAEEFKDKNIEDLTVLDENLLFKKDKFTIRVRGGDVNNPDPNKRPTNPKGLSRSILHVLQQFDDNTMEGGYVRVLSVGMPAQAIVMEAFRIAAQEAESMTNGAVLVCRQSEYTAKIGNKKAKGICTRIFGIPIRYAI